MIAVTGAGGVVALADWSAATALVSTAGFVATMLAISVPVAGAIGAFVSATLGGAIELVSVTLVWDKACCKASPASRVIIMIVLFIASFPIGSDLFLCTLWANVL
jgi:amino acid transporter